MLTAGPADRRGRLLPKGEARLAEWRTSVNLPSPSVGEGSGIGVMRRFRHNGPITPTQPSPIKGEG
jgi:hypothetical protein